MTKPVAGVEYCVQERVAAFCSVGAGLTAAGGRKSAAFADRGQLLDENVGRMNS